ncbi:MAG: hypothetical protein IJV16_06080, partial [Lachnospiraceae bacterium]|nr:hypothetical protein [Lachnospiraceae bacterium]
SIDTDSCRIQTYISDRKPVVIGVNAINPRYEYDFLLFVNSVRYDYAKEVYSDIFDRTQHILLSNIATSPDGDEYIINFNRVVKRGWEHFDNAVITALRLLVHLRAENISIAGFDGFKHKYNESYADASLPTLNPDGKWDELNEEITDMYRDFKETEGKNCRVTFVTESIFNTKEI